MFKVVKDGDKSTYYAKFKFDSNDSGLNGSDDEETLDNEEELPDEDDTVTVTGENDSILTIGEDDSSLTTIDDDDPSSVTSDSDFDLSGLMGNMDLSFNVNLPSAAISSNATTKENDNKNLSWKLNYTGVQTIEFAFVIDANAGGNNMLLYIGIGAGVLLVAIVAIVLMSKKKKPVVAPVVGNPEPTVATPTVENTAPTVEPTQTEEPKE
jgi:hypothetical protein